MTYFSDLGRSLASATNRSWFARGAIEGAPIVALIGPEKKNKSWALLDLAVAASVGGAWLGACTIDRTGPFVYVDTENGEHEVARRVARIARGTGVDVERALAGVRHRWAPDLLLADGNAAIDDFVSACLPLKPSCVGLDPWRNFLAGDENSTADTIAALRHVARIRDALGCPVVLLHHVNRSGKFAGARALRGRVDLIIEGTEAREGAAPIFRAMGRTLRPFDTIAQPFRIDVEHEHDDDETNASTRVRLVSLTNEVVVPNTTELAALSANSKRALLELEQAGAPMPQRKLRDLTGWSNVVARAALDPLLERGLVSMETVAKTNIWTYCGGDS